MLCEPGSSSGGGTANECTCNTGLATSDGSITTTTKSCNVCRADFYGNGIVCEVCPMFSSRMFSADQESCSCDEGRMTSSGVTMTTGDDCNSE